MIHVDGIEQAIEQFDRIDTCLQSANIKQVFQIAGDAVAERARGYAPKPPGLKGYATGNVASAIFARAFVRDTVPNVIVGVDPKKAPYAIPLEYGTDDTVAQPFMRRAAGEMHEQLMQMVGTAIRSLIERAVK